jgi:hypothetical protein
MASRKGLAVALAIGLTLVISGTVFWKLYSLDIPIWEAITAVVAEPLAVLVYKRGYTVAAALVGVSPVPLAFLLAGATTT